MARWLGFKQGLSIPLTDPCPLGMLRRMIRPTTLISSSRLDAFTGARVLLASETFQETGSFKFRAAHHLASHVPQNLIIAASSGNFGLGLAQACRLVGKQCIVVMPDNSSRVKVEAIRACGGRVEFIQTR